LYRVAQTGKSSREGPRLRSILVNRRLLGKLSQRIGV
jgi:hypothetical protein